MFYQNREDKKITLICSSSIRRGYNKQSTFIIHPLFNKLNTYPNQTDIVCWHDTESFDGVPFPIPINYDLLTNTYEGFGVFCSPNCAKAYLLAHPTFKNVQMEMWLRQLAQSMGYSECIRTAPPAYMLQKFGGTLTVAQFRALTAVYNLTLREHLEPILTCALALELLDEYNEKRQQLQSTNDNNLHVKPREKTEDEQLLEEMLGENTIALAATHISSSEIKHLRRPNNNNNNNNNDNNIPQQNQQTLAAADQQNPTPIDRGIDRQCSAAFEKFLEFAKTKTIEELVVKKPEKVRKGRKQTVNKPRQTRTASKRRGRTKKIPTIERSSNNDAEVFNREVKDGVSDVKDREIKEEERGANNNIITAAEPSENPPKKTRKPRQPRAPKQPKPSKPPKPPKQPKEPKESKQSKQSKQSSKQSRKQSKSQKTQQNKPTTRSQAQTLDMLFNQQTEEK